MRKLEGGSVAPLVFVALALAVLGADLWAGPYYVKLLTRAMIVALAALALDLLVGLAGLVSLGHAAFVGIGAYAVGILAEHGITSGWIQWPVALVASAAAAAVIGALSLRTRGVHFIMITLAFAQMLYFAANSLSRYGGDDGLTIWNRSDFGGIVSLADRRTFAWLCFVLLLSVYVALARLSASRFGRVLRGAKDNERRMAALGFAVTRFRLVAFVISGTVAGLAGVLLANLTEFVAPAYMSWHRSGELLAMVVLGGMGSLYGAILGAFAFVLLEELLSRFTTHWALLFGPFLVLVVLVGRGGIAGLLARLGRIR
ncbi:MAG: branched-chain amino acid ABC transporter permease [Geminicoccaceae bacterium]|nr:branched-chain amino acid ABC transporter permease [Geminicoccaceae bacterium]MCS7267620.1 branched-chain amino acid ABC transporter permease [Geminicoccaceae bacterium]MCX7630413.1 branched-chain amino acid ABC transporter permease [Geminicoccaceae bacterium]MDW8123178.1 branched-chain amino acid ABC transporter permease [Geminicoccaceae bacterium]MDW8340162.1 branched-chain amino acid ABC transporter permease [Geminicoccaceae bacterium]